MVSEKTKNFFDQKCFINVCFHERVPKAEKVAFTKPDGDNGFNWKLPYRVS